MVYEESIVVVFYRCAAILMAMNMLCWKSAGFILFQLHIGHMLAMPIAVSLLALSLLVQMVQ